MALPVRVHPSQGTFEPAELRGGLAVVIDLLRASSTIATALASGAAAVWPCREVEQARRASLTLAPGSFLLGGERGGVRIEGFDLGNSPSEYGPGIVRGKTIVFTTTNGTTALERSEQAARVVVGSFLNLGAVVEEATAFGRSVHLVCAGVSGRACSEDSLCAGAFARALAGSGMAAVADDATVGAVSAWDSVSGDFGKVLAALHASDGGRNLAAIGLGADVERCAARDSVRVVPVMRGGRIVASAGDDQMA